MPLTKVSYSMITGAASNPLDFGADNTGVADSSVAFQNVVNSGKPIYVPRGTYKINTPVTLPANTHITADNDASFISTINGSPIFSATNVANISLSGLTFTGSNSSTVPIVGYGIYSAANTGLFTATNCDNVRVDSCKFSTFYNGLTVQQCRRVWISNSAVQSFYLHGVLASLSSSFFISKNIIADCTQTGGVIAYGIHATGDNAGGTVQENCIISDNIITNIPSWSGIMSHDVTDLTISNNIINNVRKGLDIGHLVATNVLENIVVSNNYVLGTSTDTWGGAPAETGGIFLAGYGPTARINGATIIGNVVRSFFGVSGMVSGGNPNAITVHNVDNVAVTGNSCFAMGSAVYAAGIGMSGTVAGGASLTGNLLSGSMGRGGVRINAATIDALTISGNTINQTTASVEGVLVSGSTISAMQIIDNATNSTSPWSQVTSTITFNGMILEGTATYDIPLLASGAGTTTTVSVPNAAIGDFALASFGGDLSNLTVTAYVSSANVVSVRVFNGTAGSINVGSATLRARVFKRLT